MASPASTAPTETQAFIAWENRRKRRYELVGGEVRLMAGGSRAHDIIAVNILTALRPIVRAWGCDAHGSNLKVVSPVGLVTYPDLFVRCGPLGDEATECGDPVVVVEVLSPGTRSEDLVRKRWGYQAIPALRHLVYVDTLRVAVEVATRAEDGRWWSEFVRDLDGTLRLDAFGADLPLRDLYATTRLGRDAERLGG